MVPQGVFFGQLFDGSGCGVLPEDEEKEVLLFIYTLIVESRLLAYRGQQHGGPERVRTCGTWSAYKAR